MLYSLIARHKIFKLFSGWIIKLFKLCLLHGLPTGGRPPAIEARWRPPVDKPAWQAPMSMSVFGASNFFFAGQKVVEITH